MSASLPTLTGALAAITGRTAATRALVAAVTTGAPLLEVPAPREPAHRAPTTPNRVPRQGGPGRHAHTPATLGQQWAWWHTDTADAR